MSTQRNNIERRRHAVIFQAIFIALVAVEAFKQLAIFATGQPPFFLDGLEYWKFGQQIAAGDWLLLKDPVAYRTPLYPLFLAACQRMFGEYALLVVVVCQHLAVIATSLLTAWVCWRIGRHGALFLIGYALSVACLTRPWFANTVLTDSFFILLLLAYFGSIVVYLQSPTKWTAAAMGGTFAVCVMVRPVPKLLWIPLGVILLLHAMRKDVDLSSRRVFKDLLLATVVVALACLPWVVRNGLTFDWPFIARLPASNLWHVTFRSGAGANLPITESNLGRDLIARVESTGLDVDRKAAPSVKAALQASGLTDEKAERLMKKAAKRAIQQHPGQWAFAMFRRFVNYWRCVVNRFPFYTGPPHASHHGQKTWQAAPLSRIATPILSHTPARSLWPNGLASVAAWIGVFGLIAAPKTRVYGVILGVVFLYFALVTSAVVIENYRYRMVLEPLMIVSATCGISNLVKLLRPKAKHRLARRP